MSKQTRTTTTTTTTTAGDVTGTAEKLLSVHNPSSLIPSVPTARTGLPSLAAGNGPTGDNVLYLAYGSNLNSATFEGRRGIKPVSATVVAVPTLRLTFDLPGIPFVEPRFANVQLITSTEPRASAAASLLPQGYHDDDYDDGESPLVGVVYEVTPTDFATIIATEGGGSSYADVIVDCFAISESGSVSPSTEPLKAHTLLAPASKTRLARAQASARYLGLITAGAEQHNLPLAYRNRLALYKPFRVTSVRQHIGRALFTSVWLPVVFAVFGLGQRLSGEDGRVPGWTTKVNRGVFYSMWWVYDHGFKQVFGEGEHTVEEEEGEAVEESVLVGEKGHRVE